MRQIGTVIAARIAVVAVAGFLLSAAPSQADIITLNFSGTVDLSSVDGGEPNPHTFNGSITWDSTKTPFESDPPSYAGYDMLNYTLFFDGIDYTDPVIGDGTGSGLAVFDDGDILGALGQGSGPSMDGFAFFISFRPPFDILGGPSDLVLIGAMVAPTTVFGSTALPGDLAFLSQLTGAATVYLSQPDGEDEFVIPPIGTLTLTIPEGAEGAGTSFTPGPGPLAVPEPTTLALVALSAGGAFLRSRRSRKVN